MNDVEKKLAKYRAQKERQARYNKLKSNLKNKLPNLASYFTVSINDMESSERLLKSDNEDNYIETVKDNNLSEVDSLSTDDDDASLNCCSIMDCIHYFLYFILWTTIYMIFIKLQFGTVYIILSALIGIYLNTRTRPKAKGEISAYSVFNKDCKSIDGTLKAEQFEREIRYGPTVVR